MVALVNFASGAISGASLANEYVGMKKVLNQYKSTKGNPAPVGGPPGNLTGTLIRSWGTRPAGKIKGRIVGKAGTDVAYAPIHEYGLNGRPRPFMQAGIDSAKPAIAKRLRKIGPAVKLTIKRKRGPLK